MTEVTLGGNTFDLLNSSHIENNQINTELMEINGKVITRKNVKMVPGKQIYQFRFDIDHLSTGMYVLRVYNDSGTISTAKKVIIE